VDRAYLGAAGDSPAPKRRLGGNIDGLQPFVHYQRLLSLLLAVRSLSTNPILPGALFRSVRDKLDLGLNIDLAHADKFISHLENAVFGSLSAAGSSLSVRYEGNRRSILSRRVQSFYQQRSSAESIAVPHSLRRHMRAGYLRGANAVKFRKTLQEVSKPRA
jgi:hypothetical protein